MVHYWYMDTTAQLNGRYIKLHFLFVKAEKSSSPAYTRLDRNEGKTVSCCLLRVVF